MSQFTPEERSLYIIQGDGDSMDLKVTVKGERKFREIKLFSFTKVSLKSSRIQLVDGYMIQHIYIFSVETGS